MAELVLPPRKEFGTADDPSGFLVSKGTTLQVDKIARVSGDLGFTRPRAHLMQFRELDEFTNAGQKKREGLFAICGQRGWVSDIYEGDTWCEVCEKIFDSFGGFANNFVPE